MHATPLITDVLERICELADPEPLSVMARTARVLHEPAIHALWHELPGLIPLLRCFPTDSWTIEGDELVSLSFYNSFKAKELLNWPARSTEVFPCLETQGLDRRP